MQTSIAICFLAFFCLLYIACEQTDLAKSSKKNESLEEEQLPSKVKDRIRIVGKDYDFEEILSFPRGDQRDEQFFVLFCRKPEITAEAMVVHAKFKMDPSLCRLLGRCMSRMEDEAWLRWLNENLEGEYLRAARVGYVEGLATLGSDNVVEFLKQHAREDEIRYLRTAALLELSKSSSFDFEEVISIYMEAKPPAGWLVDPVVRQAMSNLFANMGAWELEELVLSIRFKDFVDSDTLAGILAERDPALAMKWSLSQKNPLDSIAAIMAMHQSNHDDDALQETIDEAARSGILWGGLAQKAILMKLTDDPQDAVDWLQKLPEDEFKKELYGFLVLFWIDQDSQAASEWVQGLSPGAERDRAIQTLVNEISEKDAGSALGWASVIGDDQTRKKTLRVIRNSQPRESIEAILESIGGKNLSPTDKDYLLEENAQ